MLQFPSNLTLVVTFSEQEEFNDKIKEQNDKIEKQGKKIKKLSNRVGFTASTSTAWETALGGVGSKIPFKVVNYNGGGRYSAAASQFLCNDKNVYFFSATIFAEKNKYVAYCIYDGKTKYRGVSGPQGASSGGVTAVIRCSPGKKIQVRVEKKSKGTVKILSKFSRFTGHRI